MSERHFRVIVGFWLVLGLILNSVDIIYVLFGILLFEGVTNFRIPGLVTRLRFGSGDSAAIIKDTGTRFSFEAERALRFIVVIFAYAPMQQGLEILWWMPWFVGFALIGAGLSGICPMVLALRFVGLR